MTKKAIYLAILIPLALAAVGAWAEEEVDVVDYVKESCAAEIKQFCSQVTPGEGRLLACFYAHGDKVSVGCEVALWEGAAVLEEFVAEVSHLVRACQDELVEHCGEVEIGEGRVASCLLEHQEKVGEDCRYAIEVTELEVVEE